MTAANYTFAPTQIVPRILDAKLYNLDPQYGSERNFLVDLIRSERNAFVGQGKLTLDGGDGNDCRWNSQVASTLAAHRRRCTKARGLFLTKYLHITRTRSDPLCCSPKRLPRAHVQSGNNKENV